MKVSSHMKTVLIEYHSKKAKTGFFIGEAVFLCWRDEFCIGDGLRGGHFINEVNENDTM
jgi:hypothetical protein